MLDLSNLGRVTLVTSLSFSLTFSSVVVAQAAVGYDDDYSWDEPAAAVTSIAKPAPVAAPVTSKVSKIEKAALTKTPSVPDSSVRGLQWKDEQKAHWEFELNKYYRGYVGNEDSLPKTVDTLTAYGQQAPFYDFVRAWDPHKAVISRKSPTGSHIEFDIVAVRFKEIRGALCPIGGSIKNSLSPQGKDAAGLWNAAFSTLNGGSGPVRISGRGQEGFDREINRLCGEAGISNCTDEFKDALKASAQSITESDKTENIEVPREVKNKSRVKWRFEPLIYANIDISKKIVDLTPHKPGQPNPDPNDPPSPPNPPTPPTPPNPDPDDPTTEPPGPNPDALLASSKILLQPGTGRYGYQYTATDMFGIGGGAGLHTAIDAAGPASSFFKQIGFVVGGMIILNRIQTVSRKVPSLKVMDPDYVFKNPTAENISKYWSIDDSFSYMGSGGLMLTFGISYASISVGPTFVSEVSEQKIVTKIAPTKVMVEIADLSV